MLIRVESTPNPETLKFLPDCLIMGDKPGLDLTPDQASCSPLARKIFGISDEITRVFLGANFVSVTTITEASWDFLRPLVIHTITDHLLSGGQVESAQTSVAMDLDWEDPLIRDIHQLIDERIRPAVAQDGGDIQLRGFSQGVVYVKLMGACVGCPSAQMTLKMGVENMLKHYVPQVQRVEALQE